MCRVGPVELLILLAIVLLLFGAKKLPALAKSLGGAIKEFKKSTAEEPEDAEATPVDAAKPPKELSAAPSPSAASVASATPAEPAEVRESKRGS